MSTIKAFGTTDAKSPLGPMSIKRRDVTASDVEIELLFCGICHSDIHTARDEWGITKFPAVPGHEMVGRVTKVGTGVSKHKVGDLVAVGCMVDSDRTCEYCKQGHEQFCPEMTLTFNGKDKHLGGHTFGGYSESIVVDQHFVLKMPPGLDPARAAPLLCAGITTYAPLKRYGVGKGKRVGIVGLGGLGHVALKFAHAFGAHVVLLTTSPGKEADAKRIGADEVVVTKDPESLKALKGKLDFILDTVSVDHDLNALLDLLDHNGILCLVGAPPVKSVPIDPWKLIKQRTVVGSNIGGIPETQEMLDFCGKHNILADVEVIPFQKVNEAYDRVVKSDVRYRFVIDLKSIKGST